jgi:fumarate reductase subunit D
MHQSDIGKSKTPRYLKATAGSALAVSIFPMIIILVGYLAIMDDAEASELQGLLAFIIASVFSISFAVVAFPVTAKYLHSRRQLQQSKFNKVLFVSLAVVSIIFCLLLGLTLVDSWQFVFMAPALFALSSIFVLPFTSLWYRLAQ